ncbi:hypothetical protein [Leptospira harrisiae]|uniref:Uncharacterized protein n=1 Tax=Leptospira harrisiae TaxID=2023189 RepID=A0A2N0AKS4_9LEPT|nr:hypothetical protein [Leptospira harrisiae]PJZ84906.1 hypothetical protein CH364_01095 [Leptospira harrisiae]PKA08409.1 hypothetical protein CH366_01095 [Leptospira harrisiae]
MVRLRKRSYSWIGYPLCFLAFTVAVATFFPSKTINLTTICIQNDHINELDIAKSYENAGSKNSEGILLNSSTCIGSPKPKEDFDSLALVETSQQKLQPTKEFYTLDGTFTNQILLSFLLARAPPLA